MFELLATDGKARRGRLRLNRGQVETPIFMPVGTVGSVKTLVPKDLKDINAQIILGNTYHLFLRPGMDVIKHFGGLHSFIGWDRPILSDSGGYQVFSLAPMRKFRTDGVEFRSHIDGSKFFLSPEKAVEIQETLGSDIHMVLDDCTPYPAGFEQAKESLQRTLRWAKSSRAAKQRSELAQFGIIQGGMHPELRSLCIDELLKLDFEGYAIGGLSVGEPKPLMRAMTEHCCERMPVHKPRYLMGVGTPLDLIESVALGVDMFDCVLPSRNGRNGTIYCREGKLSIKNAKYRFADEPMDGKCLCYACQNFSKGYIRHLFISGEITALRLLTLHNLQFFLDFMNTIRSAIENGKFSELLAQEREIWFEKAKEK